MIITSIILRFVPLTPSLQNYYSNADSFLAMQSLLCLANFRNPQTTKKMRQNFTFNSAIFGLALFCTSTVANAQSSFQYNFNAAPTLMSGQANQVNAKYRFANVSTGVDAIVTVVSATNGASIDILDDNNITKPEGFSPKIKVPANKTGVVEFDISFVQAGTTTSMIQDSLYATAIDIDGNNSLKEIDVIDLGGGFSTYEFGTPEITVTQTGTAYTGKNVTGNEYDGIDSAARKVMFTVKNSNISRFTYKCGAENNGSVASRQKSIYFKNFTYPVTGPLAVKYQSFDAVKTEKGVNLNWITTTEVNHSHFEVERSFDMNNYKTIGVVLDGFEGDNGSRSSMFKDLAASLKGQSVVYYRLKQFDLDGKSSYSKVLAVRLEEKNEIVMQVTPNPFAETLVVRFNSIENGLAQIRIINVTGKTMLSKQTVISKGSNSIMVDGLKGLSTGMYVAQMIMNGNVIDNQKVVKN